MLNADVSMPAFLALSSDLTGFSVFDLRGTGEADAYLAAAVGVVGAKVINELVDAGAKLYGTGAARERQVRRVILGDPKLGPVARCIIKMWFSGTWFALPPAWVAANGPLERNATFTVRPSSYAEGLLWKTIGANPAGAKAPGYGSWAEPPRIPDPEQGLSVLAIRPG
jgi:hypothetical protein